MSQHHVCMSCLKEMGNFTVCGNCGWMEGTPPTKPQQLPPRTVLSGRYEVGLAICEGVYSIRYRAFDQLEGKPVQVVELFVRDEVEREANGVGVRVRNSDAAWIDCKNRFANCFGLIQGLLAYPAVPRALPDRIEENGTLYRIEEELNIVRLLSEPNGERQTETEICSKLLPVARVVSAIHKMPCACGILTPAQLAVTATGEYKLIDLQCSGQLGELLPDKAVTTAEFSAPELRRSRRCTIATDVYAFGALLVWLLTGKSPAALSADEGGQLLRIALQRYGGSLELGKILEEACAEKAFERLLDMQPLINAMEAAVRSGNKQGAAETYKAVIPPTQAQSAVQPKTIVSRSTASAGIQEPAAEEVVQNTLVREVKPVEKGTVTIMRELPKPKPKRNMALIRRNGLLAAGALLMAVGLLLASLSFLLPNKWLKEWNELDLANLYVYFPDYDGRWDNYFDSNSKWKLPIIKNNLEELKRSGALDKKIVIYIVQETPTAYYTIDDPTAQEPTKMPDLIDLSKTQAVLWELNEKVDWGTLLTCYPYGLPYSYNKWGNTCDCYLMASAPKGREAEAVTALACLWECMNINGSEKLRDAKDGSYPFLHPIPTPTPTPTIIPTQPTSPIPPGVFTIPENTTPENTDAADKDRQEMP